MKIFKFLFVIPVITLIIILQTSLQNRYLMASDIRDGETIFRNVCAGCHVRGGSVVLKGSKSLKLSDLEKRGIADENSIATGKIKATEAALLINCVRITVDTKITTSAKYRGIPLRTKFRLTAIKSANPVTCIATLKHDKDPNNKITSNLIDFVSLQVLNIQKPPWQ